MTFLLSACLPDYGIVIEPTYTETVQYVLETTDGSLGSVEGVVVGQELDILWVVDTSCSMDSEIADLPTVALDIVDALYLDPFIDIGWQMGVISADPDDSYSGPWTDDAALVPDLFAALPFSPGEAGLQSASNNAAWDNSHRPTANLLIIIVSDEDEHGNISAADYVSMMPGVKASPLSVMTSVVINTPTSACRQNGEEVGTVYEAAADHVVDICDRTSWTDALYPAVQLAPTMGAVWVLPHKPLYPETSNILVSINGEPTIEWDYYEDSYGYKVELRDVPDVGSWVSISYIW